MKSSVTKKSLKLSKETVRELTTRELGTAAGGGTAYSCAAVNCTYSARCP